MPRLFIILISVFLWSCDQNPQHRSQDRATTNINHKHDEIHIDLEKLFAQRASKVVNVLYDDYFHSSKQYLGYDFLPVIDSIIKSRSIDTAKAIIIFECHDGYKPSMDLSKLYSKAKPFVVFKDLSEGANKDWPDSIQNKFAPYYLVWDSVAREDHSFMWPYGLVSFTISWMEVQYRSVYPANNPSLIAGFNLFRDNCLKCHSLNGVGGSMAPEFNFPKNITEYWRDNDIISFARNPTSYRRNSTMPPMTTLQVSDFNAILSYLKYMKDHKME